MNLPQLIDFSAPFILAQRHILHQKLLLENVLQLLSSLNIAAFRTTGLCVLKEIGRLCFGLSNPLLGVTSNICGVVVLIYGLWRVCTLNATICVSEVLRKTMAVCSG